MLKAKANAGGNRPAPELLVAGNYPARVVQVIGLGLQPQRPWEGQEKPPAYELMVTYELVSEFMKGEDGEPDPEKPRWISERFALFSLNSELAKSTKRYVALDPSKEYDGDWSQLVGKPCLVNLVQNVSKSNGKTYNNVGAISPPIVGMEVAPLVNDTRVFDPEEPDMEVWAVIPEWIQEIITSNLEFPGSKLAAELGAGDTEATPQPDPEPVLEDTPF